MKEGTARKKGGKIAQNWQKSSSLGKRKPPHWKGRAKKVRGGHQAPLSAKKGFCEKEKKESTKGGFLRLKED